MRERRLTTFDGVVDALGGLKAVAAMTGTTPQVVCMWRRNSGGRFPARTHARIAAELAVNGANAPLHLWDFDPPKTYDEPKRAKRA